MDQREWWFSAPFSASVRIAIVIIFAFFINLGFLAVFSLSLFLVSFGIFDCKGNLKIGGSNIAGVASVE